MKIWGVLFALVAFVAGAKADNKLVIEDFDIIPGETKTISVALDNSDKISSLQFDIDLPEGLSFVTGSTKMNKKRLQLHSLGGALWSDSHVRFAIFHQVAEASKMDKSLFVGNSGEIFTFQVKASYYFKGGNIKVYGIVGSDATPEEPVEHDMEGFNVKVTPSVGTFSLTETSISKHMREDATASVGLSIANIVDICGVQAYVELPENLVIESMEIGDRVSENYIVTPSDMDKSGTILLSSIMADNFAGYDGVVLTFNLKAVGAVKGQFVVKDLVATDKTGEASFKIGEPQSVDVEFIPFYTVSMAEGIENGTVAADIEQVEEGEKVKLIATPAEDYKLASISVKAGEEDVEVAAEDTSFVMPASDVTVSATFELIPSYAVAIAEGIENGTVAAAVEQAKAGDKVALTVTPAEGYQLAAISVKAGEEDVEVAADTTFIMPASDVVVSATFELIPIPTYAVAIAEGIENGTVAAAVEQAKAGDKVALTVTPAEGYQLAAISVKAGEEDVEVAADTTFIMPASDVVVSATFDKIPVPEFDIDKEFTSLESLKGAVFTIVNKETGKALYGSDNQNLGYDVAEVAFAETNAGFYFKVDTLSKGTEEESYALRMLTPEGEEYNIWGSPGYLNSQPAETGQCSFILGLNNQNGQDMKDGAVWDIQYVEGKGFTLLNKGTGKYLTSNDAAKSDEPVYWTFCTINGTKIASGINDAEAAQPVSFRKVVENGKVVIYRNGVKTTISGINVK